MRPGNSLGPYRVLAPLGAGGMGEVYKAHDTRLDRMVAIKVLPAHMASDATARERLRREALAAAGLDHPFICKIFEIGEHDGVQFIVMEFVAGETLQARLAAGRMPLAEALRIAGELAEALEEAHGKRFVHRDLKPANIMLTQQGHVKVMDFGLAKRVQVSVNDATVAGLTRQGAHVGTPDYMSPEQIRGETVDVRSDLFSYGIVLCELLGASHPFQRPTSADTMTAILRDPPAIVGDLPQGLMLLVRRLLAKAPGERYQTMRDVRAELAHVGVTPSGERDVPGARIPLIGREAERAELLRALDQAMAGHGSVVLIGGEPGIGKTHLTQALLEEARQRGAFCVTGHCYEMEGAAPYVPFVEMLEYSARMAPPEGFRFAIGDAAPEVAKLMPALRRMYPDIPPPLELPPEQQRRFLFNAYRDFVERAARVTPIVAVYEDLHWADEPTLLLFRHLAQSIAAIPTLMIGTYRDVELDVTRPFASVLENLTRERLAARMPLRRLPVGAVEAMLSAMSGKAAPPSLARVVFAETEGNPFFVEEVYRHLAEEGKLFDAAGGWKQELRLDELHVPEGVRLVVGKRLQRLSEETRRVLTTAAAIGRGFSLRLLEAMEGAHADAALEALEDAERAQLVSAENVGREPRYRFVHELIRQTLADALSLPRRQRLHARIGEAMEKVYAAALDKHAPAIAHHLYQAGTAADADKTLDYLLRAADSAQRAAAHEEALANLDNAAALMEGERSVRMADVQERRANVLRSVGRLPDAVAAYERAIALFEAGGENVRAAECCLVLGGIRTWTTQYAQADAVLQRGIGLLRGADPLTKARLLSAQGQNSGGSGQAEEGVQLLQEAESFWTPEIGAEYYLHQAWGYYGVADFARSREFIERGFETARKRDDQWAQAELAAALLLGRVVTGPPLDLGQAGQFMEQAIRVGHQYATMCLRILLDVAAIVRADLGAAERSARESIEHSASFQASYRFTDYLNLAAALHFQGREEEMMESLRVAIEYEPAAWISGVSQAFLFRLRAFEGTADAVSALHHPSLRLPVAGRRHSLGSWWALGSVVEGLAVLGRVEEVAALRQVTEECLRTGLEFLWPCSPARSVAGIAAAFAGDFFRAEEHHRSAIHVADTMPMRLLQPITRAWYAETMIMQGEFARARGLLGEALVLYEKFRMPGYARRTSERLAGL
ncbi:MAG: DUF2791 family P-loop domain-containing protein [Acidobacteria bacterium]|nr:DUF2791 family P-loop domain-containing protein [Acidobacteriota bacterium]